MGEQVVVSQQQLDLASRLVVTTMMDMIHRGENVRQLDPLWEALSGWKPAPKEDKLRVDRNKFNRFWDLDHDVESWPK